MHPSKFRHVIEQNSCHLAFAQVGDSDAQATQQTTTHAEEAPQKTTLLGVLVAIDCGKYGVFHFWGDWDGFVSGIGI